MRFRGLISFAIVATVSLAVWLEPARAEFASSVQSFTQGAVAYADNVSTYNVASTALHQPSRIAGVSVGFVGAVTPFNPPFEQSEMVAVGLGGQLTLELPSTVSVSGGGVLQVGIFSAVGFNDPTFTGHTEPTARTFSALEYGAERTAVVEVADTLGNFKSLGRVVFNMPTQGFSNQSHSYETPDPVVNADFNQPFYADLDDFNDKGQLEISAMLGGSAGGTWLNVSPAIAAQLTGVNYVRISDPLWQVVATGALEQNRTSIYDPDGPQGPQTPFTKPADLFVDGVNVLPEPSAAAVCLFGLAISSLRRSRQRS